MERVPNAVGEENTLESKEDFIKRVFSKCGCGELELHHDEDTDFYAEEWIPELIGTIGPTNAYGVVDFYTGAQNLRKSAEFIRLSDDDDPHSVIELMTKYWKLLEGDAPLLCISVLGGLDLVHLDSKKRDVFCEGLIKTVSATNAWITTFGLNCGVVSIVSDAISRAETYYIKSNGESPKIKCIGVTPWGNVRSHYNLVRSVYSRPNTHIQYCISNVVNPGEAISLNKNHTHYILVDDGIRNSFHRSNSAQYRDKIEQLIATPSRDGGCGVPVVSVVFGGGFDVLGNVAHKVQSGMPVVICRSTGGAADILQLICKYKTANRKAGELSATQITELKEMLEQLLSGNKDSPNPSWTVEGGIELLKTIANNEQFVSFFNLGNESRGDSLDKAILTALIKCATTNPIDQLTIALKFGRIDVVKQQVIENNAEALRSAIDSGQLKELLTSALLENQVEFVELVIEQEVVEMSTYLRMGILNSLYNNIDDPTTLRRCFDMYGMKAASTEPRKPKNAILPSTAKAELSGLHADEGSVTIMDMLVKNDQKKTRAEWTSLNKVKKLLQKILGSFESSNYTVITPANRDTMFPQPLHELFLWAVLNNHHEMAMVFWRNTSDALPLSIVACNIYQKMTDTLPVYDTEGRQALAKQKDYFEKAAKTIIELCYEKSQWKSLYLLIRPFITWGEHKCIPLALCANCRDFVSSNACQHAIQLEWQAGIEANPLSIILAYICPPLIFSNLIKFTKSRSILPDPSDPDAFKRLKANIAQPGSDDTLPPEKISNSKKLNVFYHAPRAKFLTHTLFKSIAGKESYGMAFVKWIHEGRWHGYDLLLILPTITTVCLRIGLENTYIVAKTFYSVLLIFYFLRIFQMYAVDRRLGPQSVMIFKMLIELGLFLLILVTFLIPYGVATQAMLYPHLTTFNGEIAKNTFYFPYYRIYGELNLEEAEGVVEDCKNKASDGKECPLYNPISPLLLALYMLIVVILLVNLLIAIFSNVFSDVQIQSLQYWKSTKYYILQEYKEAPVVPAPFSLLQALWEAISCCFTPCRELCSSSKPKKVGKGKDFEGSGEGDLEISPFDEDSDDEDDEEVDEEKEELENSVLQMQCWAVRQIMAQEMLEKTNQVSNAYNMLVFFLKFLNDIQLIP
ncbi:hypothetical protein Aperf_G00000056009 [Anoplocephala perfoliata]